MLYWATVESADGRCSPLGYLPGATQALMLHNDTPTEMTPSDTIQSIHGKCKFIIQKPIMIVAFTRYSSFRPISLRLNQASRLTHTESCTTLCNTTNFLTNSVVLKCILCKISHPVLLFHTDFSKFPHERIYAALKRVWHAVLNFWPHLLDLL